MEDGEGALGDAGRPSVNDGECGVGVGDGEGDGVLLGEEVDVWDSGVCWFELDELIQAIRAGPTHTSTNSYVGLPSRTSRTCWGTFHLLDREVMNRSTNRQLHNGRRDERRPIAKQPCCLLAVMKHENLLPKLAWLWTLIVEKPA